MPLAHQIILGVIVAGFVIYPLALLYGWVVTRGWQYGPDGAMLPVASPAKERAEPVEEPDFREAA